VLTGTPVIDPSSDTIYFFSKTYRDTSSVGVANAVYKAYAVDTTTLADKFGYPLLVDGHTANNDTSKYFMGGTHMQRPSLLLLNGIVYGAFSSHWYV